MSYPTMTKDAMKLAKLATRRLLGCSSAWQAHQQRKCLEHCWYCEKERRMNAQLK
jgi:hypothetical protein